MNNKFTELFVKKPQESTSPGTNTLLVNKARCPQNHVCPAMRVCPTHALSQNGFAAPKVDMEKCIACGKCVKYCPMRALSLK